MACMYHLSIPIFSSEFFIADLLALVLLPDLLDPVLDVGDPGVDAGVVRLAAPNSPGHDPDLGPRVSGPDLHGAAGVALR